jgi:hypothetical protein
MHQQPGRACTGCGISYATLWVFFVCSSLIVGLSDLDLVAFDSTCNFASASILQTFLYKYSLTIANRFGRKALFLRRATSSKSTNSTE